MSELYTAYFCRLRDLSGEHPVYTLEVVYPPPETDGEGAFPEFRLGDDSWVRIYPDSEHTWEGRWGEVRGQYQTDNPSFDSLPGIEVVQGLWECDPSEIVRRIKELTGRIHRRNRQIEDLRSQLAAAKAR